MVTICVRPITIFTDVHISVKVVLHKSVYVFKLKKKYA